MAIIPQYRKVRVRELYYGIHELFIVIDSPYGMDVFFLCEQDTVIFASAPVGEVWIGTVEDWVNLTFTTTAFCAATVSLDTYARPYNVLL